MLDHGADVQVAADCFENILHDITFVRLLFGHGLYINADRMDKILKVAITDAVPEVLKLLLDKSNITNGCPFETKKGSVAVFKLERKSKSNCYIFKFADGKAEFLTENSLTTGTKNYVFAIAAQEGCGEAVTFYLNDGLEVDKPYDSHSLNPIVLALENNHIEVTKLLLKAGAKIDPSFLASFTEGANNNNAGAKDAIDFAHSW